LTQRATSTSTAAKCRSPIRRHDRLMGSLCETLVIRQDKEFVLEVVDLAKDPLAAGPLARFTTRNLILDIALVRVQTDYSSPPGLRRWFSGLCTTAVGTSMDKPFSAKASIHRDKPKWRGLKLDLPLWRLS
jgi:hypothetical protein